MTDRSPNILFLLSDHHRHDWLGIDGEIPVRTPNLDQLATDGVRFTHCRCNSPLCAPSRACLATGRRYDATGVADNKQDLDPHIPNFMQYLRDGGYTVAACGKTDLHKGTLQHNASGWSKRLGQLGFTIALDHCGKRDSALVNGWPKPIEPYMAFLHKHGHAKKIYDDLMRRQKLEKDSGIIDTEPFPLERCFQMDDFTGRKSVEMIQQMPNDAPWFLQVNFASPHPPYDACQELLDRYSDVKWPMPVNSETEPHDHQAIRQQYGAMLDGMDEWIGYLIDTLRDTGQLENTVIAYTSDHGEMLGDHSLWNKGYPYESCIRVPLIIRDPRENSRSGKVVHQNVELIDLASTFLDWAGINIPQDFQGQSLLSCDEQLSTRNYTSTQLGDWEVMYLQDLKIVIKQQQLSAIYNLKQDPFEQLNLLENYSSKVNKKGYIN